MKHQSDQLESKARGASLIGSLMAVIAMISGAATASAFQLEASKLIAPLSLITILLMTIAVHQWGRAWRLNQSSNLIRMIDNDPKI